MENSNNITNAADKMLNTLIGRKMKASLSYAFEIATKPQKLEGVWISDALVGSQKALFNTLWHLNHNTKSEFALSIIGQNK